MKKLHILFLLLFTFLNVQSQISNPVKWSSQLVKISDSEFDLIVNASIENGWHLYSQFTPEGGSLPLVLDFKNQKGNYQLFGKATEGKYKKVYSDVFEVDEYYFEKNAKFTQRIKILNPNLTSIEVFADGQACIEGKCIPTSATVKFVLPKVKPSEDEKVEATIDTSKYNIIPTIEKNLEEKNTNSIEKSEEKPKKESNNSLWGIFLGTLLAGLLATFTPCVFPMIPMTVSFFLKQSGGNAKGKFNAFFYGFCIIAIYVLISIPFHLFESLNPDIFGEISTNVYLNIFFFLVFVVFAISFFGAFEITMPNSLANKTDNASNSGGLIGVFFMALTLIIVSFSCTGPALGLVLGSVLSTDGGATILTIAMLGFGFGLAFPFMAFAFFPNLMKNLPKSGGWLNTVKVVFGFIELALALKFLSNADLVIGAHLLEREVFIALWIAIFGFMTLYLLGKMTLPHDSPLPFLSVGRMLLALVSFTFTIYLIPGLWGAPLKLISAFPPPMTYSESPQGFGNSGSNATKLDLPKGAVFGPHNIVSFEDYTEGLAYAKSVNKPILIDFTGKACVNCRLMESNVWSDSEVLQLMKNDIVLISLFCDDRTALKTEEIYISKESKTEIKTIGQKWTDFEISRFKTNARPYYVLLDLNEKELVTSISYTPNITEYKTWLENGIKNFRK